MFCNANKTNIQLTYTTTTKKKEEGEDETRYSVYNTSKICGLKFILMYVLDLNFKSMWLILFFTEWKEPIFIRIRTEFINYEFISCCYLCSYVCLCVCLCLSWALKFNTPTPHPKCRLSTFTTEIQITYFVAAFTKLYFKLFPVIQQANAVFSFRFISR